MNVLNGKKIELRGLSEGLFAELIQFSRRKTIRIKKLVFSGPGQLRTSFKICAKGPQVKDGKSVLDGMTVLNKSAWARSLSLSVFFAKWGKHESVLLL